MSEKLDNLINRNETVARVLKSGGSLEDCLVALVAINEVQTKRLMELVGLVPLKIKGDDGKVYVWHCPDHLIPETR